MLTTATYNNAMVLPPKGVDSSPLGGVCTKEGMYIENSCPNLGAGGAYKPSEVTESGETVIYIGWLNQVWGHTITDVLKKIWFVNTDECKHLLESGVKLVYITHFEGFPKHVADLLALAGVDITLLSRVEKPTLFRSVIIPDDSFVSYGDNPHFTQEYIETINRIKRNVSLTEIFSKKVYFSRTRVTPRFSWKTLWMPKDVGERSVEEVFRREGYDIIYPETLSVREQIAILTNCTCFAATEGSVSHNAVFCNSDTKIAILKKEKTLNVYTELTNKVSGADATIINANASYNVKSTFYGPFFVCVTDQLEAFVGHRIFHLPYWLTPLWYWYMVYDTTIGRAIQKVMRIVNRG